MTFQPRLYFRVLVRVVVVHDEMQGDIARELAIEPAQEFQELLMPVSLMTFADTLPSKVSRAANKVVVPLRL